LATKGEKKKRTEPATKNLNSVFRSQVQKKNHARRFVESVSNHHISKNTSDEWAINQN
jgi:hypothetical protein